MASAIYYFDFNSLSMGDEVVQSTTATGPAIPYNAVISSVNISFTVGISNWASDSTICIYRAAVNAEKGSPGCGKDYSHGRNWVDATSNRVTLTSGMDFSQSDASKFDGSITVYIELAYDSSAKGVNGKSGYITVNYTEAPQYSYCTPPSNLTLSTSQTPDEAKLTWSAGGGGTNNAVTGYVITYKESSNASSWSGIEVNYYGEVSGTNATVRAADTEGHYRIFGVQTKGTAGDDWLSEVVWSSPLQKITNPTFTSYPLPFLNPSSGASTTLSWDAAGVSNQNDATIYYQYFVGPSSTYSDSYLIGTTVDLSATVSEEEIISKCGTGFGASDSGSMCYMFVRAYWKKADGTEGGFDTPTSYATFTYLPTINAPTNLTLSPISGIETTISWTNNAAGNGSIPDAVLFIDDQQKVAGITASSDSYIISRDVWRQLPCGDHQIKVAHGWYGRYVYSTAVTFRYESGLVSYFDELQNKYVRCELYYFDSDRDKYVLCSPSIYDEQWRPCGT